MYGDYSRGHEPDRKRGRAYRRVLLQMGRPVLDSDIASLVDAMLGEVRATTRGLGCAAGSPDLGFLITPGRLVTIFAEAQGKLTVTKGTPNAWIDYRYRFAGRYPALHLASGGSSARVALPVLQPLDPITGSPRAALWVRVEAPTTIEVNGITLNLAPQSPLGIERVVFSTAADTLDPLEIGIAAGNEVWLFLLEQDEVAGTNPTFWVAPGTYHSDGLIADAHTGGPFPSASFPDAAGFPWTQSPQTAPLKGLLLPAGLSAGDRVVAYLETWERHITAIEDPGIHEEALGGVDTCTRTQLIGQVKVAKVTGVLPVGAAAAEAIRHGFETVEVSGGQLTIDVPQATPTTDPCALPDTAGYSGSDNRLYRVEVHQGGGLPNVHLKWSRDNGSELFAARLDADAHLLFDAGIALAAGDIVEVLSNVVDLGDEMVATAGADGFVPPQRAVGQLAQLAAVEVASSSDEVVFRLVQPDDTAVTVTLDDRYGTLPDAGLKLRRWNGILNPQQIAGGGPASPGPHVLEDGITVKLSETGSYQPGQYWQFEARVQRENANGPWRSSPHGPERRFAPLALLQFDAAEQPLRLLAWLDERFSHPCDLDADGVAFAGARVGSTSHTVQEAIEELFERPPEIIDGTCGELIVRPDNDLQAVFDTIGDGESRRICFQPGSWTVKQTVIVAKKGDLIISGAGAATQIGGPVDSVLRFVQCGRLSVQDLTINGGAVGTVGGGLTGAISAINCGGLDLHRLSVSCGDWLTRRVSAVEVRSDAPGPDKPEVRIRDCHIQVGNAQVGLLVVNPAAADIEGNTISSPQHPLPLVSTLSEPTIAGRVGRLLIDDYFVGKTAEATDELLVGSPDIVIQVGAAVEGRQRFIVHLKAWGYQFITFWTTLPLTADEWQKLFQANPIMGVGTFPNDEAPAEYVGANLRKFRAQLVRNMFNLSNTAHVVSGTHAKLVTFASTVASRNSFSAGGQGIVVCGQGTPIDPGFPEPRVLTGDTRPDVHITANRVMGFVQGIHVAASRDGRALTYRADIAENLVHLRVPSLAGERHGIFVGSVFHLRLAGNSVELRTPGAGNWATAGPLDAIRVSGTFGPMIQVHENSCIGSGNGMVAHATNHDRATNPGWRWAVANNAHIGTGGPAETINW